MAQSKATTVEEYLAELPGDRRAVIAAVRAVLQSHLPEGYREGINWGMIVYQVPLKRYPNTYNKQPLVYACLAAQKNHYALYLNCVDAGSERGQRLQAEFTKAGKKLDMGKSCIRFRTIDDLPLDVIGRVIAETPINEYIARYEASRKKG
jgi:uncharacterized protein YdhG (YjbR/CyaY superfamily)